MPPDVMVLLKARRNDSRILHDSLDAYIDYNEDRPRFSLDINNPRTPLRAFPDKKAAKAIRKDNLEWMEVDTND